MEAFLGRAPGDPGSPGLSSSEKFIVPFIHDNQVVGIKSCTFSAFLEYIKYIIPFSLCAKQYSKIKKKKLTKMEFSFPYVCSPFPWSTREGCFLFLSLKSNNFMSRSWYWLLYTESLSLQSVLPTCYSSTYFF